MTGVAASSSDWRCRRRGDAGEKELAGEYVAAADMGLALGAEWCSYPPCARGEEPAEPEGEPLDSSKMSSRMGPLLRSGALSDDAASPAAG